MLFIRADANQQIATGHIMRCMSIASEFKKHDVNVIFIIADKRPCELLERQGFQYICLNSKWNDLNSEIELMIECIKKYNISRLLIDTYYVTVEYLSRISTYTKTIYIDDLASVIYPVHMLINYNNYSGTLNYENKYKNRKTKLLLGCDYTPLRDEFVNVDHRLSDNVKKVLVTTGGTDQYNIAGKFLDYIFEKKKFMIDLEYHVIIGKYNANFEYLEKLAEKYKNIVLHYDITNISEIMLQCDIAITAGGSTTYELCACAVPMITYSFADNQLNGTKGFERLGIAKYCGDIRNQEQNLWERICTEINEYKNNYQYRFEAANKMKKLVDSMGTSRIYKEINNM